LAYTRARIYIHTMIAPAPDTIARLLPDTRTILLLAPLSLVYGLGWAALVALLRRRGLGVAYTRKIFHFAIFTAAAVVELRWGPPGVMVFGTMLALVVITAVFAGRENPVLLALTRPREDAHRRTFVLIPLITTAAGGLLITVLFPGYAYIGYLVCGWGDAVGEPVGMRWGRHRYKVPSMRGLPAERSIEGSAAVFVVGSIAAILGLLVGAHNIPIHDVTLGIVAGAVAAVVEAITTHGLDNFTIQVAVAGVLTLIGPMLRI
jgi:phytol kinase